MILLILKNHNIFNKISFKKKFICHPFVERIFKGFHEVNSAVSFFDF